MPYNTGNPVPSTDARDFMDNVQNTDVAVNTQELTWTDRLGVSRKTFAGMEKDFTDFLAASGFEPEVLEYVDGTPLTVDRPTQLIERAATPGILYAMKLPATFPAGLSGTWSTDEAKLVIRADDSLRHELSQPDGFNMVGGLPEELDSLSIGVSQVETPLSAGGQAYVYLKVQRGNWTQQGGRVYFFNPDAVDVQSTLKNSVVVLGGRGDTGYRVTVGPNAELAFHGGGGDTLIDHLAGTICGGAHHKMTKNNAATPAGSHGFIGGGSYQEVYGDYGLIVAGTLNKNYATKATIVGGDSNRIGNITDQSVGRNGFIGGGYLNTLDGQYAWIPSGQLCKAQKDYSSAWGYSATSNLYGTMANSSGKFSVDGDNNTLRGRLRRVTTDGIATQLLLDGSSQSLVMGSNTLWTGRVLISALRTDTVETASYSLTFSAYCNSSGVVTIKSQSLTVLHEDNASYNVDVTASGSSVSIRAVGVAASNIRWSASFEIDELRNI